MIRGELDIVILGLSIISSWGNGHATTYRGLVRELELRGHRVLFLERDVSWYADNRDMPEPPFGKLALYSDLQELKDRYRDAVRWADLVIVGSYVPQGVEVSEWVTQTAAGITAFYDIDTPITLHKLRSGDHEYIAPHLLSRYDLYLSFTGGPILQQIQRRYGAPCVRPLYCSCDPEIYSPSASAEPRWDLGYLGTYSDDRQPSLQRLMLEPAWHAPERGFIVAGPQYPNSIEWPSNVERIEHVPPSEHRAFYTSQRFTLNITRTEMIRMGYSPSVRLFEAAACATPILSDYWDGLETFLTPGQEILITQSANETLSYLSSVSDDERHRIGERARRRILAEHTAAHRAAELESYIYELQDTKARSTA